MARIRLILAAALLLISLDVRRHLRGLLADPPGPPRSSTLPATGPVVVRCARSAAATRPISTTERGARGAATPPGGTAAPAGTQPSPSTPRSHATTAVTSPPPPKHQAASHPSKTRHRAGSRAPTSIGQARPATPLTPVPVNGNFCPGANLTPNLENLESIRTATVCLINQERMRHGESPLQLNGQPELAAQAHTEDTAFGDYFDHVGRHGDTPVSRMRAAGYIHSSRDGFVMGENIAWAPSAWPRPARSSPPGSPRPNTANILDAPFRDTAVGVSRTLPPSSLAGPGWGCVYAGLRRHHHRLMEGAHRL